VRPSRSARVVERRRELHGRAGDELPLAGTAAGEVELIRSGEDEVAVAFGIEPQAVHAPEETVVTIELCCVVAVLAALPIRGAGDDEAMEMLQGASIVAQFTREPVEQFGMRWHPAHSTEIARGIADAATEMIMPYAVRDAAPGERVLVIGNPIRECGAAFRFVTSVRFGETCGQCRHRAERAALCVTYGLVELAAFQNVHDLGPGHRGRRAFAHGQQHIGLLTCGIDERWRGQLLHFIGGT